MADCTREVYQSALAAIMLCNKVPQKAVGNNKPLFSHSLVCRLTVV